LVNAVQLKIENGKLKIMVGYMDCKMKIRVARPYYI
jgi:hypothetical protein